MKDITYKIVEVATGLYQLKMPLPFRLDHINLYLIEDLDGWVLVDTGLNTEITKKCWNEFMSSGFFKKPVTKIVLTHLHPDHIGMASWLSESLSVPVFISKGDWDMAQFLWNNDQESAKELYKKYWLAFGLGGDVLEDMIENRLHYKKLVKQLPSNIKFLDAGGVLVINDEVWELVAAQGHSPEHICLFNRDRSILISGDHVLPTITPNISLHPFGLINPLSDYLKSLHLFLELDCTLYFPAHGPISENYRVRILEIIEHHKVKCEILMRAMQGKMSVAEIMPILFSKDLPSHQLMFAYAETAAHLVYLAEEGYLEWDLKEVWMFSLVKAYENRSVKHVVNSYTALSH